MVWFPSNPGLEGDSMPDNDHINASDESAPGETSGGSIRVPPYISFKTFLTFLEELKTNGIPPQIDGSVLKRFAGGIQSQLKIAIRSLQLIDGAKPTSELASLVDAYQTPQFEGALAALLKTNYPYVFQLNLMTATPTMFADSFKVTGAKEDVSRKCRTFFLHAAKEAQIPLGPRILNGSVPRSTPGNGTRRRPKIGKTKDETATDPQPASASASISQGHHHPISDKALEYKLVDLMKEDDVGNDERSAIWTLIQYLTQKAKNRAASQ
jgi:hypothetical protein